MKMTRFLFYICIILIILIVSCKLHDTVLPPYPDRGFGEKVVLKVCDSDTLISSPGLAKGEHNFGLVWMQGTTPGSQVHFGTIEINRSLAQSRLVTTTPIAQRAKFPVICRGEGEYALAYVASVLNREKNRYEERILLNRRDENGGLLELIDISSISKDFQSLSLIWNPGLNEYALVWLDEKLRPPLRLVRYNPVNRKKVTSVEGESWKSDISKSYSNKTRIIWDKIRESYLMSWTHYNANNSELCIQLANHEPGSKFFINRNEKPIKIQGDNLMAPCDLFMCMNDLEYLIAFNIPGKIKSEIKLLTFSDLENLQHKEFLTIYEDTENFLAKPEVHGAGSNSFICWEMNGEVNALGLRQYNSLTKQFAPGVLLYQEDSKPSSPSLIYEKGHKTMIWCSKDESSELWLVF